MYPKQNQNPETQTREGIGVLQYRVCKEGRALGPESSPTLREQALDHDGCEKGCADYAASMWSSLLEWSSRSRCPLWRVPARLESIPCSTVTCDWSAQGAGTASSYPGMQAPEVGQSTWPTQTGQQPGQPAAADSCRPLTHSTRQLQAS